jgi:hypothetical protein
VLHPGAIATAVSMAEVGQLTNRSDPRLLIAAGALIFATAAWHLSTSTGESGTDDLGTARRGALALPDRQVMRRRASSPTARSPCRAR